MLVLASIDFTVALPSLWLALFSRCHLLLFFFCNKDLSFLFRVNSLMGEGP